MKGSAMIREARDSDAQMKERIELSRALYMTLCAGSTGYTQSGLDLLRAACAPSEDIILRTLLEQVAQKFALRSSWSGTNLTCDACKRFVVYANSARPFPETCYTLGMEVEETIHIMDELMECGFDITPRVKTPAWKTFSSSAGTSAQLVMVKTGDPNAMSHDEVASIARKVYAAASTSCNALVTAARNNSQNPGTVASDVYERVSKHLESIRLDLSLLRCVEWQVGIFFQPIASLFALFAKAKEAQRAFPLSIILEEIRLYCALFLSSSCRIGASADDSAAAKAETLSRHSHSDSIATEDVATAAGLELSGTMSELARCARFFIAHPRIPPICALEQFADLFNSMKQLPLPSSPKKTNAQRQLSSAPGNGNEISGKEKNESEQKRVQESLSLDAFYSELSNHIARREEHTQRLPCFANEAEWRFFIHLVDEKRLGFSVLDRKSREMDDAMLTLCGALHLFGGKFRCIATCVLRMEHRKHIKERGTFWGENANKNFVLKCCKGPHRRFVSPSSSASSSKIGSKKRGARNNSSGGGGGGNDPASLSRNLNKKEGNDASSKSGTPRRISQPSVEENSRKQQETTSRRCSRDKDMGLIMGESISATSTPSSSPRFRSFSVYKLMRAETESEEGREEEEKNSPAHALGSLPERSEYVELLQLAQESWGDDCFFNIAFEMTLNFKAYAEENNVLALISFILNSEAGTESYIRTKKEEINTAPQRFEFVTDVQRKGALIAGALQDKHEWNDSVLVYRTRIQQFRDTKKHMALEERNISAWITLSSECNDPRDK